MIVTIEAGKKDEPEPEATSMVDSVVDTIKGILLGALARAWPPPSTRTRAHRTPPPTPPHPTSPPSPTLPPPPRGPGTLSVGTFPVVGSVTAKTLQIMGRACFAANKLGKAKLGPKTTYAFLTFVMTAFGGGVLCPLLLGSSPKPLQSDTIIVVAAIAYLLFTQTDFKKVRQWESGVLCATRAPRGRGGRASLSISILASIPPRPNRSLTLRPASPLPRRTTRSP